MNVEELSFCQNEVEDASMHSYFHPIKKEGQPETRDKVESVEENMYKPASQLVEIKMEDELDSEEKPHVPNDDENIENNGDAAAPTKVKKQKRKYKKRSGPYDIPSLPSHLLDSYYDLDVSQEFLSAILRYVDDLCNIINNGDPNLARSMEVNEQLNKAVRCYRNELMILESKDENPPESYDQEEKSSGASRPKKTTTPSSAKKRRTYQVITNETFELVKKQCGIHSGNEMAKILNVHERNLQRKMKQNDVTFSNSDANPESECHFCKIINKGHNPDVESTPPPTSVRRTFQCTTCDFICLSKSLLRQHNIDIHDKEKPQCSICFLTFGSMQLLKKHVESTHGKKSQRTCVLCNITFNEKDEYNAHNASFHDGKKAFQCQLCQQGYAEERLLKNHITTVHEGVKPYICNICGKKFPQQCYLKYHMQRVHEGQKPCLCTLCGSSFFNKNHLKRHFESVHERKKPHHCTICNADFTTKQVLQKHIMAVHEGLKPYLCTLCGSSFADNGNLRKHIASVHQGIKRQMKN